MQLLMGLPLFFFSLSLSLSLDLSAAFNTIDHILLQHLISSVGMMVSFHNWLTSYMYKSFSVTSGFSYLSLYLHFVVFPKDLS